MPVLIDTANRDHHLVARGAGMANRAARTADIDIALVNNMPDTALIATERQIFDLLAGAAKNLVVRLHFYTMETMPRSEWGQDYARRFYLGAGELMNRRLDAVIVTGAEPHAADLSEEPYWTTFGRVVDWAKENTTSAIFSCLAVHGAVLHMDGVKRRALSAKCIGVFAQTRTEDHELMRDVPLTFRMPHARWNEVEEESLSACGYSVLAKSAEAGVDCFVKQQPRSLFVYFQGHPEYEASSLLGEYRRDLGRYLRRENDICPTIPKGYLDRNAEAILVAFRSEAISNRSPELFASFPADRLASNLQGVWRANAKRIYRNWLSYLMRHREAEAAPLSLAGTAT